jgi:hypothetical protein
MTGKITATVLSTLLACGAALAQGGEPPKMTPEEQAEMEAYQKAGTPGPEHAALAAATGSYTIKIKSWLKAGATPIEDAGTVSRSMTLDGRVRVEECNATMFGAPMTGHGMMGYDNVSKKYWSTWMDTMSTGMMTSTGTCDANHSCKFTGTYNDAVKKAPVTSRMTSKQTSPTTEVFEMYGKGKDGKEFKMMEITYTKQ